MEIQPSLPNHPRNHNESRAHTHPAFPALPTLRARGLTELCNPSPEFPHLYLCPTSLFSFFSDSSVKKGCLKQKRTKDLSSFRSTDNGNQTKTKTKQNETKTRRCEKPRWRSQPEFLGTTSDGNLQHLLG